ncbi:reverse transcriptase domain-containing protein [Tanacetum coccineum]
MRTRSQARKRRQQQVRQTSVESTNLEKPNNNPPIVTMDDNRTMAQLLEAPTEGYEDAIVVPEINANNFEIKHGLLNLVQNKQFFGHDKEDPHAHIRYFNKITSTMKFPNVPSTSQRFDKSFYEAWDRFNDLLKACPHHGFSKLHQLDTFYNALNTNDQDSLNSAAGGNFLDKMPRECLKIIERKSKVHNSQSKPVVAKVSASTSTSGISPDVSELKDMVKALLLDKKNQSQAPAHQTAMFVKAVEESYVTCGGAHSYQSCPATDGNDYHDNIQAYVSQATAANFHQGNTCARPPMVANQIRPPGLGTLLGNTVTNPKEDLKGITTRSGVAYQGPTIPSTSSSPLKMMNRDTEVTKDKMLPTNNGSTEDVQPLNCSAVILNKLPKKLGDPGRFLIPCEFSGINTCNALADLGASINLMPYSVWKDLSLPELTPTCMTLELVDRSFTEPIGIAKDVRLMVGKFQFPADFVVVDFEPDPRVPLILGRSFLKTSRALIDVYEEYSQEVLGFSDSVSYGNPSPDSIHLFQFFHHQLTPFGDSDFLLLEESQRFIVGSRMTSQFYGKLMLLTMIRRVTFLFWKHFSIVNRYLLFRIIKIIRPESEKNLKLLKLKPTDDKLPVIIAKDLKDEEKAALIKVLKSYKRAIAWKLSISRV